MKMFPAYLLTVGITAACLAFATPAVAIAIPPLASDTVYVSDVANGQILKFSGAGSSPSVFADFSANFGTPYGLTTDSVGNLYAVISYTDGDPDFNFAGAEIRKFSPSGASSIFADSGDGLGENSLGLAYAGSQLYVSNGNEILRINAGGVGSVFASGGQLDDARGLATDSAGNVYVADLIGSEILKYTSAGSGSIFASGGSLFASGGPLEYPLGLAVDGSGNVFASGFIADEIIKFTSGGVGAVFADDGDGLSANAGLAFDSAGNLLVAEQADERISSITPGGVRTLYGSSAGSGPFFIAVSPVPEPGTAVLGGLAALGFLAAARKRRAAKSG